MANDWPVPTTAADLLRMQEKRLTAQERRQGVEAVSDVVGPGIAAQAIELFDWNDDLATFNGFFYSAVGAMNSPDETVAWTGQTIAYAEGGGMQQVWDPTGTAEVLHWTRTYSANPDNPDVAVFGPWKQFATHTGRIGAPELDPQVVEDIETALQTAADAMGFTETAIRVFRQGTEPDPATDGPFKEGWVWYNTASGNDMLIWREASGTWERPDAGMTEEQAAALERVQREVAEALEQASELSGAVAAKITAYWLDTEPTGTEHTVGDVWFDTAHGNRINFWDGTAWVDGQDKAVADNAEAAALAQQQAQSALDEAAAAIIKAGQVEVKAQEALDDAAEAIVTAGGADTKAQEALDAAAEAITTAGSADTKAQEALDASAEAITKAESADNNAIDANTIAAEAQRLAALAETIAQEAAAAAALAQQAAAIAGSEAFFSDTEPVGTTERPLKIDDVWYDTNDGYTQYRWTGSEWVKFSVSIPDFSITVKKFNTSSHFLY